MNIKKILVGIGIFALSSILAGCTNTTSKNKMIETQKFVEEQETTEKQVISRESWDRLFTAEDKNVILENGYAVKGECNYKFLYYIYADNTVEIIGQCYESNMTTYDKYDIGTLSFDDSLYNIKIEDESLWNYTISFEEDCANYSFKKREGYVNEGVLIKILLTPKETFTEKTQIKAFEKLITIN